ncbi:1,4-dihydroxy-6-naphthoate synthase [soil metagenome]
MTSMVDDSADRRLTLGFSPCPNDTFIFHALVHDLIPSGGLTWEPHLEDVETLNQLALAAELDVTKVSYGAVPYLLDRYVLLRSGGALGRGCGPLLVARDGVTLSSLQNARIAVPGRLTTANMLMRLALPGLSPGVETIYSDIMPAVANGEADAGLIIHESRFTYHEYGLVQLIDLGEWWERDTGAAIPLGGILARRSLGEGRIRRIEGLIRDSVDHAFHDPAASAEYMSRHAHEMDPSVMRKHVELYVNELSRDLGDEGEAAVRQLLARAAAGGLAPESPEPFLP